MQDWSSFLLGILFFFVSHSIPTRPKVKHRLVSVLGKRGFTLAYSILSIAALTVLILAARTAPHIPIWHWESWQNHLALTLMFLAIILVVLSVGRPNPLSFGGSDNALFDPNNPGIVGWFHHPLLVALLLWSSAHLVANGDLAHVIMFGLFGLFSLLGRTIINKRTRRELGTETWEALRKTRLGFKPSINGSIRFALGIVLFAATVWAHEFIIGISPLP
ncbi:NnrU family protein [Aliiroseovarius crassostreae]|uniref:NnrU family protein n=1 Tax=Aliiroseovarius crassostreae TaxID=154981 RepID=A0A9Q9LY26_9RHOB|nr:NnrU family protein [Aliiroseovarius crassostreae]UWP94174.1 NnrU family protein [Aliiroseovarius crassostreae]